MIYLTDEERELCKRATRPEHWGDRTSGEIRRLAGAFCWEIYDKWNGENLDWIPMAYERPLPL